MLKTFEDLEKAVHGRRGKLRVLVVAAHDAHTLEGVNDACVKGIAEPVLIGDSAKIRAIIADQDLKIENAEIIHTENDDQSAEVAVRRAADGEGDILMKGKIPTPGLLRVVVDKKYGLKTGDIMSHVGLFRSPTYHKLFVLTDGGMITAPDLGQKRMILENAVDILRRLGVKMPKVAVLCANEEINPKIQASLDAAQMKRQNEDGLIKDCIVEGPISFDLMYDPAAAKIKGFDSPVAGDADILLMPDMTSGNLVAKTFMLAANGMMAGIIAGAKTPIVLVSRGASAEEKYWSLVFAAAVAPRL